MLSIDSIKKLIFKKAWTSILIGLVFAGLFGSSILVFAIPPTTPYNPGETLNPDCNPSDPNCTIVTPTIYSFGGNNFSGTGNFTTTGTVTAGVLKIGSVLTFPTTDGTPGQALTTNGSGALSWSTVDTTVFVPYSGATANLNLGAHNLTVDTNTFFVDATNHNVGIGTTTPDERFQIDASTASQKISIKQDATHEFLSWWVYNSDPSLSYINLSTFGNNNDIRISGKNVILQPSLGNVGIGTTTPNITGDAQSALTISAGTSGTAISSIELQGSRTTNTGFGLIRAYHGSNYVGAMIFRRANSQDNTSAFQMQLANAGTMSTVLWIDPTGKVGLGGNGTPANILSVTGSADFSGNVGIGTTNPGARLEIYSATNKSIQLGNTTGIYTNSTFFGDLSATNSIINFTRSSDGGYTQSIFSYDTSGGGSALGLTSRNDIKFVVGATTDRGMIIKDTGNVGIGTTSPGAPLEIYKANSGGLGAYLSLNGDGSAVGNSNAILFNDSGVGSVSTIRAAISSTVEASPYYGNLQFKTGKDVYGSLNTRMTILGSGNVGIGTVSPTSKLDVYDTNRLTSAWGNLTVRSSDAMGVNLGGSISLGGIYTGTTAGQFGRIAGLKENATDNNYAGYLAFYSSKQGTGLVEGMRLDSNGNVGIGTTSPGYPLTVSTASTNIIGLFTTSSNNNGSIQLQTTQGGSTQTFALSSFNGNASLGAGFAIENITAGTKPLFVNGNGNVGIGTTSPDQMLTIYSNTVNPGIHMIGDTYQPFINLSRYYASANGPYFSMQHSRGSQASPAVVQNNDRVGYINGSGYSATAASFIVNSGIKFEVDGTPDTGGSTTDMPGRITFWTTPDGSATLAERIRIDNTGNVGIGTTSPGYKLDVGTAADDFVRVISSSATGQVGYRMANATQSWVFYNNNSNQFIIRDSTATTNPLTIEPGAGANLLYLKSGNVGIGTTSPGYPLEVAGNIVSKASGGSKGFLIYDGTNLKGGMQWSSSSTLTTIYDNGGTGLITLSSGNVGIGTTSPLDRVHVYISNSTVYSSTDIPYNGLTIANLSDANISDNVFSSLKFRTSNATSSTNAIGSISLVQPSRASHAGDFTFQLRNAAGNYSEVMRVMSTGNVGIGTTAPDRKLYVMSDVAQDASYSTLYLNSSAVGSSNLVVIRATKSSGAGKTFVFGVNPELESNGGFTIGRATSTTAYNSDFMVGGSGNVGIGTTSPTTKLHIYDATAITNFTGSQLQGLTITGGTFAGNQYSLINFGASDYAGVSGLARIGAKFTGQGSLLQFGTSNSYSSSITNIAMTIDSSGNVGIGTTAPGKKLQVIGDVQVSGDGNMLQFTDNPVVSQRGKFYYDSTSGQFRIGSNTGVPIGINSEYNANVLLVNGGGNVGIGTTSPSYILDVSSATSDRARFNVAYGRIDLVSYASGSNAYSGSSGLYTENTDTLIMSGLADSGNIRFVTKTTAGGYTQRAVITSGGNVGIGTTEPTNKLQVENATNARMLISENTGATGATSELLFRTAATVTGGYIKGGIIWEDTGLTNARGKLHLAVSNSDNSTSVGLSDARLTIQNDGNVGIGTTSPGAKLDVAGDFRVGYGGIYSMTIGDLRADAVGVGPTIGLYNRAGYTNFMGQFQAVFRGGTASSNIDFDIYAGGNSTTPKMTIQGTGNVGIGTTNPTAKLTIAQPGDEDGIRIYGYDDLSALFADIHFNSAGSLYIHAPRNMVFEGGSSYGTYFRSGTDGVLFNDNNTNKVILASGGGNVGIGTTSPGALLHVSGGDVLVDNTYGFSSKTSGGVIKSLISSTNSNSIQIGATSGWGRILFYPGGSEAMRINSSGGIAIGNSYVATDPGAGNMIISGNVGIGTTSPIRKLHILDSTNGAELMVQGGSNDDALPATISLTEAAATSPTGFKFKYLSSTNRLDIVSGDSTGGTFTERMSILRDTGNVGIGTTSPGYKLEVNGTLGVVNGDTTLNRLLVNKIDLNQSYNAFTSTSNYGSIYSTTSSGGVSYPFLENANLIIQARDDASNPRDILFVTGNAHNVSMDITRTGNVGIGVTNPGGLLNIGGTNAYSQTYSKVTWTDPSASNNNIRTDTYYNASTANNANAVTGIWNYATTAGSYDITGNLQGIENDLYHGGTGTLSNMIGFKNAPRVNSAGNITNMYGIQTANGSESGKSGNVTNSYGIHIGDFSKSGSGTVTNNYGLFISSMVNGTNNYAIYSSGGTNYFGGNVGIGTTSPGAKLVINDDSVTNSYHDEFIITNVGSNVIAMGYRADGSVKRQAYINSRNNLSLQLSASVITATEDGITILDGGNVGVGYSNPGTAKLAINGNVGIGTTSPGYLTEIVGGSAGVDTKLLTIRSNTITGGTSSTIRLVNSTSGAANYGSAEISAYRDGSSNGNLIFRVGGNGGDVMNEAVRILYNGNVGIGTTSPGSTLTVVGTTNLSGGTVTISNSTLSVSGGVITSSGSQSVALLGMDITKTMTHTGTGQQVNAINFVTTYNQPSATSIKNTDLLINRIETNLGTTPGAQYLVDAQVSGTSKFRVDNTGIGYFAGNVGIGTTSPGALLHVNGSAKMQNIIFASNSVLYTSDTGTIKIGDTSSGNTISISNSATSQLVVPYGNVGIGTTAPGAKLDVFSGDLKVTRSNDGNSAQVITTTYSSDGAEYRSVFGLVRARGSQSTPTAVVNNDWIGSLNFSGYDGSAWQYPGSVTGVVDGTPSSGNVPLRISFITGTNGGNRTERLTIKNDGNVGIGTTSPGQKLTVQSNTTSASLIPANATNGIAADSYKILGTGTDVTYGVIGTAKASGEISGDKAYGGWFAVNSSAITSAQVGLHAQTTDAGNSIIAEFYQGANARMVIKGDGNVGIGTTSPGAKLVVGDITGQNTLMVNGLGTVNMAPVLSLFRSASIEWVNAVASGSNYVIGANPANYTDASLLTSAKLVINAAGNVGIGTTNPGYPLTVSTASTNVVGLFTTSSNNNGSIQLQTTQGGSTQTFALSSFNGNASFGAGFAIENITAGTKPLFVNSSGNVGIGTTNPTQLLSVGSSSQFTVTSTGRIAIPSGVTFSWVYGSDSGSRSWQMRSDDITYGDWGLMSEATRNGSDWVRRLYINGSGNIGIGMTSPTNRLQVHASTAAWAQFENSDFVNASAGTALYVQGGAATGDTYVRLQSVKTGGNAVTDLIINNSGGNVGIGTTSPNDKLEVYGGQLRIDGGVNSVIKFYEGGVARGYIGNSSGAGAWFSDDIDNDLVIRGESAIALGIGATQRMRITSTGNVGIGITNPGTTLHVVAPAATSTPEYISKFSVSDDAGSYFAFKNDSATDSVLIPRMMGVNSSTYTGLTVHGLITTDTGANPAVLFKASDVNGSAVSTRPAFQFSNVNTVLMTILGGGNVGIGTTSPKQKLELYDTSAANLYLRKGSTTTNDYSELLFGVSTNEVYHGSIRGIRNGASSGSLTFLTQNVDGNYVSLAERMRIDNTGNVGIGTTQPTSLLNIVGEGASNGKGQLQISNPTGTANTGFSFDAGTASNAFSYMDSDTSVKFSALVFRDRTDPINSFAEIATGRTSSPALTGMSRNDFAIWNATSGKNLYFGTNDGTGAAIKMTILGNGNVGIGTTNPTAKMDINGSFYGAYNIGNAFSVGTNSPNAAYKINFENNINTDFTRLALFNGITTSTGGIASPMTFKLTSTGDMSNGHGPGFLYAIQDNAGVENFIARTAAYRNGADNSGNFQIDTYNAGVLGTVATFTNGGNVGIGTTSPTAKLELKDGYFYLAGTDVAHGMTDNYPTSVFGAMGIYSPTAGGLRIDGYSDTDATALVLVGGIGSEDPTDTTPAFVMQGRKKSGTGSQALGALETVWQLKNYSTALVTVLGNGNVGIGTTAPGYRLQVGETSNYGYVDATGAWQASSDIRYKSNIVPLGDSLNKILALEPIRYDAGSQKNIIGFSAQDVEKQFPELVSTDINGMKGLNYAGLTAPIIQSIKELTNQIKDLKLQINPSDGTVGDGVVSGVDLTNSFVIRIKDILAALGLKLDNGKASVNELCIGETCVNEAQLKELLNKNNVQPIVAPQTSTTPETQATPASVENSGEVSPTSDEVKPETPTPEVAPSTQAPSETTPAIDNSTPPSTEVPQTPPAQQPVVEPSTPVQ